MTIMQPTAELSAKTKEQRRQLGNITGVNHLVLVTNDMEKTARFYCELLRFRIVATHGAGSKPQNQLAPTGDYSRLYFLRLENGDGIAFVEFPGRDTTPDASFFDPFWPPGGKAKKNDSPSKMDHLAFNVDSYADLIAMQSRLREHGVPTSEVQILTTSPFLQSIYFYDPNGIPIELSTWDRDDPAWKTRTDKEMFVDRDPIPYLSELEAKK